jgi:serine O-acetyltransferase
MKLSTQIPVRSSGRSICDDRVADRVDAPGAPVLDSRASSPELAPVDGWAAVAGDYRRHGAALNVAFASLFLYRFGRWALRRRNPVARALASKLYGALNMVVANVTKIWIPPQATIGRDFHIIHTEGSLSIHPEAVIGDRVGVMHNVTIGTNMRPGAPVIGDDVFIGVNSTVLGRIRIGDRVRIAANTAVTTNVPADSTVVGSPAKIYPRLGAMQ